MSSAFFERAGLDRGTECAQGYPELFTIVGVDISAEELSAKFAGDEKALAIIKAAQDRTRLDAMTPAFLKGLREGVPPPIDFALIVTARGKAYDVVLDGRQRCLAIRYWNERVPKSERRQIEARPIAFRKTEGAGLKAALLKSHANIRVEMSLESLADRAAEFSNDHGLDHENVALHIGVEIEQVPDLLAWAEVFPLLCPEAVKAANARKIALKTAKTLARLTHDEQRVRLTPRASSEPPRPKAVPARAAAAISAAAERASGISDEARAVARFFAGEHSALDGFPAWRLVLQASTRVGVNGQQERDLGQES